jgi:nucleoside-diphosphate-sugar epimerase
MARCLVTGGAGFIGTHLVDAGEVRSPLADVSKAKETLGYEPSVGSEECLTRTHAWFLGDEPLIPYP